MIKHKCDISPIWLATERNIDTWIIIEGSMNNANICGSLRCSKMFVEHNVPCKMDATSTTNKFAVAKFKKCNLRQ